MLERKHYKVLWVQEGASNAAGPGGEEVTKRWLCRGHNINLGCISKVEEFTK